MKRIAYYLLKNQIGSMFLHCLSERRDYSFWLSHNSVLLPVKISDYSGEGTFCNEKYGEDLRTTIAVEIELEGLGEEASKDFAQDFNEEYAKRRASHQRWDFQRPSAHLVTKVIENDVLYEMYFQSTILHVTIPNEVPYYDRQVKWKYSEPSIIIKIAIPLRQEQKFRIEKGENHVFRIYNC